MDKFRQTNLQICYLNDLKKVLMKESTCFIVQKLCHTNKWVKQIGFVYVNLYMLNTLLLLN
ncbi:hypothetical protein BpHYR1_036363 [Brachionus plicatilis]|uniref:Uncharacterized protein n=1 Tax=Brachionus plicatilis TaxID=10195 RepID=A0A3M7P5K1_BRAPC|nr:hypothetical protein BpHYR1_036363 [Brachionus plicatilis]